MSIELFAIGSSGLALVALVLMVASRTETVTVDRQRTPRRR
jgi:hypothetical protein